MMNVKNEPKFLPIEQKQIQSTNPDARRLKLKKATQAFEAIFIAQMLKSMRSVSFGKEESGFGKDIMLSLADEGVSQQLAKDGMLGIGNMLYQRLIKHLDGDKGSTPTLQIGRVSAAPAELPHAEAPLNKVDAPGKQPASKPETTVRMEVTVEKPNVAPSVVPQKAETQTQTLDAGPPALRKYLDHIREAATENDLPEDLLKSMIMRESSGNPYALSRKGAAGLMQLMPDTARAVGVDNRFDPKQNISGGAKYLRQLLDRFGDLKTALAAYNAGPGNVAKQGGMPPFSETEKYVKEILSDLTTSERVK